MCATPESTSAVCAVQQDIAQMSLAFVRASWVVGEYNSSSAAGVKGNDDPPFAHDDGHI